MNAHFRSYQRTAIAVLLLLAPTLALAGCDYRMGAVMEAANQQTSAAPLNYLGQQFVSKGTLSGAWSFDQNCHPTSRLSTRVKATLAGSFSTQNGGSEQTASQVRARTLLHEAYLTAETPGEILIDIGKKDIANGYMLFLSPMDIQRTPIDPPPYAVINAAGPSWRSFYREGRVGVSAKKFLSRGTLELAAFPALGNRPGNTPVSQWNALQRSNDSGAVYAAYSANLWSSFNPKLVARVTSKKRHVVAIGVSDVLLDSVVFTVEAAHSSRGQVDRISQSAADLLFTGGFPEDSQVFERSPGSRQQFAVGVRMDGPRKTTLIGEMYYQSDGYSRSDWRRYFQFSDHALAAYAVSGLQPYLDYQRLLLSAADSDQRRYVLLGRRYLTLGVERAVEGSEKLSWHVSVLGNVDDKSALLNLHLAFLLAPRTEFYLGGRAMLGGKNSEFGRFGVSPLTYLGLNFSL